MDDRHGRPYSAQAGRDLQDAPRVTAHDDIRPRREDACDLLALELGRDLGMREVVHARAATTPSPLCACSAPQHTCSTGADTRWPPRSTTRTVARSLSPKLSRITQPAKKHTSAFSFSAGRYGAPSRFGASEESHATGAIRRE